MTTFGHLHTRIRHNCMAQSQQLFRLVNLQRRGAQSGTRCSWRCRVPLACGDCLRWLPSAGQYVGSLCMLS